MIETTNNPKKEKESGNGVESRLISETSEAISPGVPTEVYNDITYTPPRRSRRGLIIAAVLGLAVLAAILYFALRPGRSVQTATVGRGTIISSVETTGRVEAEQTARLSFKASGRVEKVLVEPGDFVEVGQVLAELDTEALGRRLEEAKVQLEISKLKLQQAQDGPLPSDVARATADLDAARARLEAIKKGPTEEDIAAAQAGVNLAQAKLDALKKGAGPQELSAAQARLDGAKANRNLAASTAANNKEQARLALDAARKALADGKGTQTQVEQAESNYNTARSNETSQVAAADAQVREAQAALDRLKAGATPEELKAAEEGVAQARATLEKAQKGATPEELTEAQSRVDAAQAALDRVNAGATPTDLAILEQGVALAQLSVDEVSAQVADAKLTAPFSGTVLAVTLQEGELVGAAQQVATIADTGTLRIRGDIDEMDVGRVRTGQVVTVTLDAYPGVTMPGRIDIVSPGATQKQGSTVYAATISFTPTADVVPREGMAANVDITAQRKDDVLLVPNRAIETVGRRQYVTVQEGDKTRRVEIETGLSNRTETEVISGLSVGQAIILR
jgi:HlyD family secretion protein